MHGAELCVFISYYHKDKDTANKIEHELKKEGFKVIIDDIDMKTGDNIEAFIKKCIRESEVTLLIVSSNSLSSTWVALEIIYSQYESDIRDRHFMPCIIDYSIFDPEFPDKTLDKLKKEIKFIDERINKRTINRDGIEDIQNERTRLKRLEYQRLF